MVAQHLLSRLPGSQE